MEYELMSKLEVRHWNLEAFLAPFLYLATRTKIIVYAVDKYKKEEDLNFEVLLFCFGDSFGARTQDPNIKSVVLYRLS